MSKLVKSHWGVSGNTVQLTVPFAKVDEEKRLVSGFATMDNVDSQGDVVLADASAKAFARARGNIREMHQPIAAGRLVDFREDSFYDAESGKFYRGIFVTAYVSRGAESTWEKVLDGTLTGFSIGGEIKESETEFVKDANATIRFVKDYELIELSLVDNPANPLANVFSIQKSAEGSITLKGMVAETQLENVFWCENDHSGVARTVDADTAHCLICGVNMENIGWVESGAEKAEKVREVVTKFLSRDEEAAKDASEGGVNMETENNEVTTGEEVAGVDEQTENVNEDQSVDGAEGAEVDVVETEGAAEEAEAEEGKRVKNGDPVPGIDEVKDESEEIQKKMDALMVSIDESLTKSREESNSAVRSLEEKIETLTKSMETKFSEFDAKMGELDKGLATAKSAVTSFEKSLDAFNSTGALKKSGEVETSTEPEKVQKDDDWNGAFSVKSLFR